jgi:Domain of unknown function (DUF397)
MLIRRMKLAGARDLSNELMRAASPAPVAKTRIGSPDGWLEFLKLHDWSCSDAWEFSEAENFHSAIVDSASVATIDLSLPPAICKQVRQMVVDRIAVHKWTPWSPEVWGFELLESDIVRRIWRRSSYQRGYGGVEVARLGRDIGLRDAKQPEGPILLFSIGEWQAFIQGVKAGEFDFLAQTRRTA